MTKVFEMSYFLRQNQGQFGLSLVTDNGKWEIYNLANNTIRSSTFDQKNNFKLLGEEIAFALWRTIPHDKVSYQTDFLIEVLPVLEIFFHEKLSGCQNVSIRAVRIHPRRAEFVVKASEPIKWVFWSLLEKLSELYGETAILSRHELADGNQLITMDTYQSKLAIA